MASENGHSLSDRAYIARERIRRLEERGADVSKAKPIIDLAEKLIGKGQDEKIEATLKRLKKILDKKKRTVIPEGPPPIEVPSREEGVVGKEGGSKAAVEGAGEVEKDTDSMGGPDRKESGEPDEIPTEGGDKKGEPEPEPKPEPEPIVDEGVTESPKVEGETSEGTLPADKTTIKEGEESAKEPAAETDDEEEKAKEPPLEEDSGITFDIERAREDMTKIHDLLKEVESLEGDASSIQENMVAMADALQAGNGEVFDKQMVSTRTWLLQYLEVLRRSSLENMLAQCEARITILKDFNGEESTEELSTEVSGMRESYSKGSTDSLSSMHQEVSELHARIGEGIFELEGRLRGEIQGMLEKISDGLPERGKDPTSDSIRDEVESVGSLIAAGNIFDAYHKARDTREKADQEKRNQGMKKLERILLSVEPLLSKIGTLFGTDSEVYRSLIDSKNDILQLSESDVDGALKEVEDLLDSAARSAAEAEERQAKQLEESIAKEREKAHEMKESVDIAPVVNILIKAQQMVIDNNLDTAKGLLEKGIAVAERLRERKKKVEAQEKIKELETTVRSLQERSLDTSPMEEPLGEARRFLKEGDFVRLEGSLAQARERLGFLEMEVIKVEYQKILIPLLNELREMRDGGIDASDKEEAIERVKSLYTTRKYKEALEEAKRVQRSFVEFKLGRAINEQISMTEGFIEEARGLALEMSSFEERLAGVKDRMVDGEIQDALDAVSVLRVEVEDILNARTLSLLEKEIKGLAERCARFSLNIGDIEGALQEARKMASEDRYGEAMEYLQNWRVSLSKKVAVEEAKALLVNLNYKIQDARSLGIETAPYKASLTKSRVLLEAGDMVSCVEEAKEKLSDLEKRIDERRELQGDLDRIRGSLLAQEGKISKLMEKGIEAEDLREKAKNIRGYLDALVMEDAETKLATLDSEITARLRGLGSAGQVRPTVIRPVAAATREPSAVGVPAASSYDIDPEAARKELFKLVPRIKQEIIRGHSRGEDTESFKEDLGRIQKLVASRDYLAAYQVSRKCFDRLREK